VIQSRPHIRSLLPYPPGRPIEEVQREYGLKHVIKLASNENPLGPSPKALGAMRRCAREMHLYPDGNIYYLKHALSSRLGVAPEQLMFGNGSDEALIWLVTAYLSPRDSIVVSEHSFIRYQMAAQLVGARFKAVPLVDWRHDVRAMARAVASTTKMLFLANPENPLGTMIGREEFEYLLRKVPRRVMIVLDQAYFEYVAADDYFDGIDYLDRHPNLVVMRTFSKAYGLAGLRIGYGVAHPKIASDFNRIRPPFHLNRMAQEAAVAALDDDAFLRKSVEVNQEGRGYLCGAFARLGLDYVESHTNFVLVKVGDGATVSRELMRRGVIVRPMGGYGFPDHVRVTIGRPTENARFVKALKAVLRDRAVG
jgi:histidinol-phosphate aminotransferase